jgi:hypothetical protein
MIEPGYVLENGQRVPYVPIEIKDHREAYAATLHVLFKHVADFHICVVKTFSKKYGIPEDEIMQTIQESDEFKHMRVDPVLHHDGLGYLSPQPQPQQEQAQPQPQPQPQQEPEKQKHQEPVAKKRIVKKKSPANHVPAAVVPEPVPVAVIHDPVPVAVIHDPVPADVPVAVVEKRKVIRKKVPPPPVALDLTTERNDPPVRPDVLVPPPPPTTQKKIIRKKS